MPRTGNKLTRTKLHGPLLLLLVLALLRPGPASAQTPEDAACPTSGDHSQPAISLWL